MALRDEVYRKEQVPLGANQLKAMLPGLNVSIHTRLPAMPTDALLFGPSDCAIVLCKKHWVALWKKVSNLSNLLIQVKMLRLRLTCLPQS